MRPANWHCSPASVARIAWAWERCCALAGPEVPGESNAPEGLNSNSANPERLNSNSANPENDVNAPAFEGVPEESWLQLIQMTTQKSIVHATDQRQLLTRMLLDARTKAQLARSFWGPGVYNKKAHELFLHERCFARNTRVPKCNKSRHLFVADRQTDRQTNRQTFNTANPASPVPVVNHHTKGYQD